MSAALYEPEPLPLAGFPRLRDVLVSDVGEVMYALQGVRDGRGRPSLHLRVDGTISLRCQRCLGALTHEVQAEQLLVLASSQEEIDAEPATVDQPDRVVAGKEMLVRDLVEDELILALPYAPRHEDCEPRHEGIDAPSERAMNSPFAGLRGMMPRKH